MRIRRLVAVGAISLSACAAYELSSTSQAIAVVNVDNPFVFTSTNQLHTFTVTVQSATDNDNVTSVTPANALACQNFVIDAQGLPAHICGGSVSAFGPSGATVCPINYTFDVTYIGTSNESCLVDIAWSSISGSGGSGGSGSGTATLMLSSSVAAPSMKVSPGSADFGQVPITTTSNPPVRVTVTNDGAVPLTVSGFLSPAGGPFAVTPVPPATLGSHTLAVGSADGFDVTCTPPAVSPYNGSLAFTANTGSGTIMKTATFACQGINSTITITPSQVTFPSTLVNRPPVDQSVMITGPGSTTVQSIALDATAQGNHVSIVSGPGSGTPLGMGGVSVTLHYAADAKHDAGPLGKLSVKVSSDAMARDVGISGEALPGSIGTNPAAVELGPVCAGGSASVPVEVYANQAGDVSLLGLGSPSGGFTVTSDAPKLLRGNHVGTSAMVTVETHPTAVGDQAGSVALHTDIPAPNTDYTLALHATVLPAGTGATPDHVHFGSVELDTTTSGRDVTLTNCTGSDLAISGASIVGPDKGEFSLVKGDMMTTLKPTESAVFTLIMSAHSNGEKSGTLAIATDGGTISVPLDGTVGGSTPRETYYACAAGGSSAAAVPIGLALLALRRRRR